MSLPNPGMDAVPFTPLTAEFLDDMIENIEALADGSAVSGLTSASIDWTTTGKIWWEEIGRATAASTVASLTTGTIPAKKHLTVLVTWFPSVNNGAANMRFNGDSGSNYNIRFSKNGAADSAGSAATSITTGPVVLGGMGTCYRTITNIAAYEKQVNDLEIVSTTAGAATTFDRFELIGKWANTSNQITEISIVASSGSFLAGTELIVLGHD